MTLPVGARHSIRTRLTLWYAGVLTLLLLLFGAIVFAFQYVTLTRQIVHDEVQDVATVEGLLFFDRSGHLQLRQDYFSRPQSHLLIDRMMEVIDLSGTVQYRSEGLHGQSLGGVLRPHEGETGPDDRTLRLPDGRHVLLISHIHGIDGRDYVIRLAYDLAPLHRRMQQFVLLLLAAFIVTIAVAAAVGQSIARRALAPLERMAIRAEGITVRNLHDRLDIANPHDELGMLAGVFNGLLERLEQAFQHLERFTADAAHELRTPLASLRAVGEVSLSRERSKEELREAISSILEETVRLSQTIDSLLLLARAERSDENNHLEVFAIGPLLAEVLSILTILMEERELKLLYQENHLGKTLIRADRSLLRVAILNVLHNAIKFSPDAGTVRVILQQSQDDAPRLLISIEDEGLGLHGEAKVRVFERFYKSAQPQQIKNEGTGLGLSIAHLVIQRADGTIWFDDGDPSRTRCQIELPVVHEELS